MVSGSSKDVDRRQRRTKRIFKSHFLNLIKEKGYKNVTVTDIVKSADYNRSTFYLYFKDKEDLTEELVKEVLEELKSSFHRPFKETKIVEYNHILPRSNTFFQHFYEHKDFYSLLNFQDTIPGLPEMLLGKMKEIFYTITYISNTGEDIHIDHFSTYKMYGSYGVIVEWIGSGYVKPPEEIADNLLEIFKASSSSFRFE